MTLAEVQAFLDAVDALSALMDEDDPDTDAVLAAQNAVIETYDALSEDQKSELGDDYAQMVAGLEEVMTLVEEEIVESTITWDAETATLTAIGDGTKTLTAEMLTEEVGADYKDTVKTLVVDGYSIGPQLFMNSPALESVQLSNVKEIGYAAFQQDTNLTEFVLNSSDDTRTVIGNGAFSSTAIRELALNNAKLKNGSFGFAKNLTRVTLNNCDIVGLAVFGGSEKLIAIELNNSNVTGNEAFSSISNLSSFSMTGGTLKAARVLNWAPKLTSITLDGVHVELYSEQQGDWYPLNGLTMGTDIGEEKLKVTIKNSTLTKECLCSTIADELYLENVTIPDGTWPFSGSGRGELKVTIEGGSFGKDAFWGCNMKTLILKNVTIADDKYPFSRKNKGDLEVIIEGGSFGKNAFWNSGIKTLTAKNATIGKQAFAQTSFLTEATLENVDTVGAYAFWQCPELTTVTFSNTDGKKTSIGDANTSCYTFEDCPKLATITGIEHLALVGGRAFEGCTSLPQDFITDLANSNVILGYSSVFKGNAAMEKRMAGILSGKFSLNLVPTATELRPESWADAKHKIGEDNSTEKGSTQITKEAEWADPNKTVADVTLQFNHSQKPGMDFLFIVDLSDSMARIGNAEKDSDSRYYSMQSKLIDVSTKLVTNNDYDNRVAFVTFGGYVDNSNPCHLSSNGGFTSDPAVVEQFAGMEALSQNTDYLAAFTAAKKLVDEHDSSRKLAVIFISDGRPTREGTTNLKTVPLIDSTVDKTAAIARGFEEKGVDIFGVLQSVPSNELKYAKAAMEKICTDKLVFPAENTEEFSEAVNRAIGAAYGTYIIEDNVGEDFDLDVNSITLTVPEGSDPSYVSYEVINNGRTIKWTVRGLPLETYTLSFKENLKQVEGVYPTGEFETNNGPATVNETVNTVDTPVLDRHTLTVKYVYEDGTKAADTVGPQVYDEGVNYNVASPSISGYTPDTATVSGTMPNEDVEVTVVYTKNPDPYVPTGPSTYTLTVEYKYNDGKKALDTYKETGLKKGDDYNVPSPEIEGYTYDIEVVEGTMPGKNLKFVVTYTPVEVEQPDPEVPLAEPHKLTVHYVYEDGTTAFEDYVKDVLFEGDAYSVDSPVLEGYTFDIELVDGVMPNEDVEFTVVYTPVSVDVPDEETPTTDLPDEQPPLADLPDEQPPLVELPDEQPPLTQWPDTIPVVDVPDEQPPMVDIPVEDVPMVGIPQTGDFSMVWYVAALLSMVGLAVLTLKKREDEEG